MKNDKMLLVASILIVTITIFYILTIRVGHNWGGDFSMFIHHAKNIVEGKNYGDIGYVYNKYVPQLAPKTYPPIFPLLLSPVYYVFGLNLTAFKVEIIIFFMLFLFLYYFSFRHVVNNYYLISLIAIITLNPYFWDFKDQVLSDIPFTFFIYVSLYLITRFYDSENPSKQLINGIVVGIAISIAYGTRTLGFVLIPSIFIYEIVKFRRPTRFLIITAITFLFFVILNWIFFHNDSTYIDIFNSSSHYHFGANITAYRKGLEYIWIWNYGKTLTTTPISLTLARVLFVVITLLSIIGYIKRIRQGLTIYEIFPILYMIIVVLFPFVQSPRYLIPIIPLYLLYAMIGIKTIKFEKYIFATLIIVISLVYSITYRNINYGPIAPIGMKVTTNLFRYIKEHSDDQDVFIFRKPRVLSLYTDRKASVYHEPKDDRKLWIYFHHINADYIVADFKDLDRDGYLAKFIDKYRSDLDEVYFNTKFDVYRIKNWPAFSPG